MFSRKNYLVWVGVVVVIGLAIALAAWKIFHREEFQGQRAYADVLYQVNLGPRIPNSQAHDQVVAWIQGELSKAGWAVEQQSCANCEKLPITNIIGKRGSGKPWIILGAHYDSRLLADQDPDPAKRSQPVPGANDGASGVAVLLELARTLPANLDKQIWLVFIDAEDDGDINGYDWLLGSRWFVQQLTQTYSKENYPDAAIIIDMIGDKNLDLFYETNSNAALNQEIWKTASNLGYTQFTPRSKFNMLDDHTPFLEAGIPAVDIIDFDFPPWHTTSDTADQVSAESLNAVGSTLLSWLINK